MTYSFIVRHLVDMWSVRSEAGSDLAVSYIVNDFMMSCQDCDAGSMKYETKKRDEHSLSRYNI